MNARGVERLRPEDYRERWLELVRQQKVLLETTDSSALVFRLGTEVLALPTAAVQEVTEGRQLHSIPRRKNGILLGLTNCRGELLICFSLSALLGIPATTQPPFARMPSARSLQLMPVLNWRGSKVGFPVDEVLGTFRFRRVELRPPPPALQTGAGYTLGLLDWQDRIVAFLDADLLVGGVNQNLA